MSDNIADEVEADLIALSCMLTEPGERECLRCFLLRMLTDFGCDRTHRWAVRWRDVRAPDAVRLTERLTELGGACDCEVLLTVFPEYPQGSGVLPCAGQPQAGSAVPCTLRVAGRAA